MAEAQRAQGQACEATVVGPSSTLATRAAASGRSLTPGSYVVVVEPDGSRTLALVTSVYHGNYVLVRPGEPTREQSFYSDRLRELGTGEGALGNYYELTLRLLGEFDQSGGFTPRVSRPPLVGSCVRRATTGELRAALAGVTYPVRLGTLRGRDDVEVNLRADAFFRHAAVLAVTGAGKSNAVCALVKTMAEKHGATVLLFDFHGEYVNLDGNVAVVQTPVLSPFGLHVSEALKLVGMPPNAVYESRLLREAVSDLRRFLPLLQSNPKALEEYADDMGVEFNRLLSVFRDCGALNDGHGTTFNYFRCLSLYLERVLLSQRVLNKRFANLDDNQLRRSGASLSNRLDEAAERYGDLFTALALTKLEDLVVPHRVNVYDLSELDESEADVVVSYLLRRVLEERKRWVRSGGRDGYPTPVLVVLEEAHVLLPRDGDTETKYWASRVAREGRKFGVGLVVVSQRPRRLDPDVLSQTNTKVLLRLVEPEDLSYVQQASEQLGEELAQLLPGLGTGEALVLGEAAPLPVVVKVDRCDKLKQFSYERFMNEWASGKNEGEVAGLELG